MSAVAEAKEPAEAADVSELLLAPEEQEQPVTEAEAVAPIPAETDDQISDAPVVYESQTIDINGVRHEIINQGQDETGQPVVVLKNEETGDHIVLPLSALVGESPDAAVPDESLSVDPAAPLPDATDESQPQNEVPATGEDGAVSQPDDAVMPCVSALADEGQPVHAADEEAQPEADAAATNPDTAVADIGVDQLQTLADQAGVEQQLLQVQQPVEQQQAPEVNGINGDIADEAVLQAGQETDASAVNQITFDPNTVIDVAANGANGSSLEALVAGATVVAGEDGNQFVIIPSEDGSATGQQINLADVIGEADGSGQTYLIQTDDGLVACSAAPEVVEKVPQSPIDQIASNEQAILEAVLASGNFSNGQVIHAVSGDQTMAYSVQISSEGAALIPIGPVVNNAPASPKKILGRSRPHHSDSGQGTTGRTLTSSGTSAQRARQMLKNQSNVQYGNARSTPTANRSQLTTASKSLPPSNQVTVTRINPPSRSSQQSSTASSSLTSDVSLLTAVTGPSQLSSSRRTYSKKNILWVNPESSTKSASSDSAANEKSAVVPALVSTNSNMTVSATTVTSTPVTEQAVSPVAKKQNPILTSRTSSKPVSPPKQQVKETAKEEVPVREPEKKKEAKKEAPKSSLPEPIKKTAEKTAQPSQKAQTDSPVKKANDESSVLRKSETTPKKKEPEVRAPESEPTRRSNRASKRVTKAEEEVTPVPEVKEADEAVVVAVEPPAEEPASQKEVVAEVVGKRSARRSTSTEKKEEPTPQPSKSTRTRSRSSKAPVETEATSSEVTDQKEEPAVVEAAPDPVTVPVPEPTPAPAPETPAPPVPEVEQEPAPTPAKSTGRRGRKVAEKVRDAADSSEKTVSETETVVPETPVEPDSVSKASTSVRRSGRASKRKVEDDFVSEIEPEALGERPARKSRMESASPAKDVKPVKEHKAEKAEKAAKSVSDSVAATPAPAPEASLTNSHGESPAEDVVVQVAEKKETIAVTPKKRVGFREAVDDTPSPSQSPKRVKSSTDSSIQKSVTPRRVSTETKLTPILKPSKETPKGRRLASPIVCSFTPYDEEEDRRQLRKSISSIAEKRSQADHYEISSPNLTIHVRHQSASSTATQGSGTYACQKCGYNTSRINNLTLHHKNQCPVVLTEWQLGWQNEIKKQQTRTPATETPVPDHQSEENACHSDAESPVPEPVPSASTDLPAVEPNDVAAVVATAEEKTDGVVTENDVTPAAAVPTTDDEVCPPSDDEEDGVTDSDSGILKSNSRLFDNI